MRHFSPPPPPPSDAAASLEELTAYRVREKLQGELREDRKELLNKMDGVAKSLSDKIGGVEKSLNDKVGGVEKSMGTNFQAMSVNLQAMHTKIDSTKVDISVRAAGYAFAGGAAALSVVGFVFEKNCTARTPAADPASAADGAHGDCSC